MYFQSNVYDDSIQNSASTFEYMKKFIHCMYKNNLFINDGLIYDTNDGCRKQYRCVNTM